MFEKLLSNLPYNPGLVNQLRFYAKRLHREEAIRRTGLVFIVLAFFVQFFAFISPPQSTSAYSTNDMIEGGISSQSDAFNDCQNNTKNYGDVLNDFGISCAAIKQTTVVSFQPTAYNDNLYSMGWLPYGSSSEIKYNNLPKVGPPIYARKLSSFDQGSGPFPPYTALKGQTSNGRTFFILFGCGNLVFISPPTQRPICPWNGNLLKDDSQCFQPCPENSTIPIGSAACHPAPCPLDKSIYITNAKCTACPYDQNILRTDNKCVQCPNPRYPGVTESSSKCKPVCPYNSAYDKDAPQCKPCTAALSRENAVACIVEHKTAANLTTGQTNADGTTAQPDNLIVYTLFAQNKGKATVKDFLMQENLSDVLDYATVVDLHGGKISSSDEVTWPQADIKAGATMTHQITVRVLDPIPQTPPDPADPGHFDHIMTNVYGNTVNINVPGAPLTPIETAGTSLPNTGPGSSLIIAGAIAIVAGYFFARARLLVDESMIAVQETTSGGL